MQKNAFKKFMPTVSSKFIICVLFLIFLIQPFQLHAGDQWKRVSISGPLARVGHAVVYDPKNEVIILFGGTSNWFLMSDTWEWNGKRWKNLRVSGPSARSNHSMAYDPVHSEVVLFGGFGSNTNETWTWNGTSWTRKSVGGPGERYSAGMAFDPVRKKIILYGGISLKGVHNDMWEWDGSAWKLIGTFNSPGILYRQAMATIDHSGKVLMQGGSTGIASNSPRSPYTWLWDGNSWTVQTSFGPAGRSNHGVVYDSHEKRIMFFGGTKDQQNKPGLMDDLWQWKNRKWSRINIPQPDKRYGHAMAYDVKNRSVVLVGGWGGSRRGMYSETWVYGSGEHEDDNGDFTETALNIESNSLHSGRLETNGDRDFFKFKGKRNYVYQITTTGTSDTFIELRKENGIVIDSDDNKGTGLNGKIVFTNYTSRNLFIAVNSTYRSPGGDYKLHFQGRRLTHELMPRPRADHAMAFGKEITLLFGGAKGSKHFNDTWKWDGESWNKVNVSAGSAASIAVPSGRARHAIAFDKKNNEFIMFGGKGKNKKHYGDTWIWNGGRWNLASQTGPSPRQGHGMVYDESLSSVVLIGGMDTTGTYLNDVWKWNGQSWEFLLSGEIEERAEFGLTWNPERKNVTVIGGKNKKGHLKTDILEFLGDRWNFIGSSISGSKRAGHALAYYKSPSHSFLFLFGGSEGINLSNFPEYTWNGFDWYQNYDVRMPSTRAGHALVFDDKRYEIVLFGGWIDGEVNNETWIRKVNGWKRIIPDKIFN